MSTSLGAGRATAREALALAKRRRRGPKPEEAVQMACVQLLSAHGLLPVHIPNEGLRSLVGHAMQIKMGLYPGFPDLAVFGRRSAGLICLAECKAPGKPLQPHQDLAHEDLRERGLLVFTWDSLEACARDMAPFLPRRGAGV